MSVNAKMTAIADKIRTLLGISGAMGLDAMATNVGNAVSEVDTQSALIQQIKTELEGKVGGGVTLPTLVVKSGTTTSRTVNTGLSDIDQFFIYKESQTATGLIHLHYSKAGGTSRLYASAWTTNNYGTKNITNGTGGVSASGGTITISATQAAQGALSSGVTYKWIAVGTE